MERVGTDASRSQDQFHSSSLGDLAVKRKLPEKQGKQYTLHQESQNLLDPGLRK